MLVVKEGREGERECVCLCERWDKEDVSRRWVESLSRVYAYRKHAFSCW